MTRPIIGTALVVLIALGGSACTNQARVESNAAEVSIGKLVSAHDRERRYDKGDGSFGSSMIFAQLEKEYRVNVQTLPLDARVDFFWSSMWHLGFDGDEMAQFQDLLLADCGDAFIGKLEAYVAREKEFRRNASRLHLSEMVLKALLSRRQRH
jgi:hypothetical protein